MKNYFLYFLITISVIAKPISSLAQVDVNDSLALVDLYNSTDGSNWTNHTGWLTGPVTGWYGVGMNEGRVSAIALQQNNLTGIIPSSIGNLSNVSNIFISSNHLSGIIPPSVGKLTKLESFGASENQLSGNIPSSFSDLTKLYSIFLWDNQLTGPLPSFENYTNLVDLEVSDNQLSGPIPSSLQHLVKFILLNLDNNQFSGTIPEWLGNFTELDQLTLEHNQLTRTIPPSLGNLKTTTIIDLSYNQLRGTVPDSLKDLASYATMIISHNALTFNGMEALENVEYTFIYYPQSNIPLTYNPNTSTFSVYAGGTLSNNTYKWYRNGVIYKTVIGDSTLLLDGVGSYYVEVTNSIATQLTLTSDSINVVRNIKAGNWSDPATWINNTIPGASDVVLLNFDITVDINTACKSLNSQGHTVHLNNGVQLNVTGN